jgi:protein TIF31
MSMQFARVALNPDSYFHLSNGKDKADKISEQEEILRAAQKLKDEVIGKLIDDFNSVEVDPLNGEQMSRIMHARGINLRYIGRLCTSVNCCILNSDYRLNLIISESCV